MFAMICTDNLRYQKTKYYDSEYIVKGALHINEHVYTFAHYEGAFDKHEYTGTRDELLANGYKPCGKCKP